MGHLQRGAPEEQRAKPARECLCTALDRTLDAHPRSGRQLQAGTGPRDDLLFHLFLAEQPSRLPPENLLICSGQRRGAFLGDPFCDRFGSY